MTARLLTGLCLTLWGIVASAAEPITLQSLLGEMIDRDRLARWPEPAYTCKQASSYDRASVAPDKPGWFANNDTAQFIRTEKTAGREEHVMMDADGPGAVVRFWMGAPDPNKGVEGRLRFYLDGSATPAIDTVADLLFNGKGEIPPPLSAITCIGRNLYLPIPYAKHCKITYEGAGNCWYNIEYRTWPAGTEVRPYSAEELKGANETIERIGRILTMPANAPSRETREVQPQFQTLGPGESMRIGVDGPASIRRLTIRLDAADLPQALRSTVLMIECDGEQTVWCPVGDFFGSGIGLNPYRDWYREVDRNGTMTCWWVMPFEKSCKIALQNLGQQKVEATLGKIGLGAWSWDDRSMHFRTNWRQQAQFATKKQDGFDWNYIQAAGRGVYVGDTLALHNGAGPWWGEGDEKIWVDDDKFPSHFGTGSEDYYGYSFGDRGTFFEAPFHAEPRWDGNNKFGFVTVTRTRSLDAIPFEKSLKFDMEVWHWSATTVTYGATTYWYARPGATTSRAPMPEEARRAIDDLTSRIPGTIEAETMKILAKTGGVTELQHEARWSGGTQLWWRDGKPGDRLELALPVGKAGRYRVSLNATRAFDYGIFQLSIDGKKAGDPVDLYRAESDMTLLDLGLHDLTAGEHRLAIEIVGSNPAAKPRHMIGVDYVKLKAE
ncbi:MAG: DUF2961 domain-containing protein [Tepidisphaerales bacterium]